MRYPLLRYPGSKDKLWTQIASLMPADVRYPLWQSNLSCYCEPFFGSGAIGWRVMSSMVNPNCRIIINDIDPGVAALWQAVRDSPVALKHRIERYKPSVQDFERFKADDGNPTAEAFTNPIERGFRKLALHRISFSGLGAKAGGPLGGRRQGKSEYSVDCRWKPQRLMMGVDIRYKVMNTFNKKVEILNYDFERVLECVPSDGFVYLDPPYYVKGGELYKYPFDESDHIRLAGALRSAKFRWLLSYDCHPRIRELYEGWASITPFDMTPTTQITKGEKRRKNRELLISNIDMAAVREVA